MYQNDPTSFFLIMYIIMEQLLKKFSIVALSRKQTMSILSIKEKRLIHSERNLSKLFGGKKMLGEGTRGNFTTRTKINSEHKYRRNR